MAKKNTIDITDLGTAYAPPTDASASVLAELEADARERAIALLSKDNYTDEEFAQAEWLAAAAETCKEAVDGLAAVAQERQTKADELRNRLTPAAADTVDEPEAPDAGGQGGTDAPAAVVETTPAPAEAVVASGSQEPVKVPSISDVAKTTGQPNVPATRTGRASLVAAADVPGFASGQELTERQIGEAWLSRAPGISAAFDGQDGSYGVNFARVRIDSPDDALVASGRGNKVDVTEQLNHACDESRLATSKGSGSLVAAGGWCAPSQPLYDLLNLMSEEGLLSVPEISAPRGGLQWATGPDFTAVWSAGQMFTQTETQAIAGTPKPQADVPCPGTQSARMVADGLYLTSGILLEHAWPEAVADFIAKAQIAFQHYVSGKTIADIVAGSTAVDLSAFGGTPTPPAYGALKTVLGAVALQIEDMKYKGRLSRGQSVEVKLPFFARGIFRSDLWAHEGTVQDIVVTDAQIDAMFTALGCSVEYVYDWQDAVVDGVNPTGFGGATPILSWPQTFKVLMYPAGTWARAIEPVINLNAVYDSTLLTANKKVALFQEQGRLTIKRGFDSRIIKVASNPNGGTGGVVTVSGSTPTQV
ncbi:major capsid protein [uncultured Jatrophihabitans sp.]|uniref:major capsid protein n=1 Tax=uncultured Jatrophihabitans sp. TaxID=1610747 RepID=UPI0035C958C7